MNTHSGSAPENGIEHEPGWWAWRFRCSANENTVLSVAISACDGDRHVTLDDGGDPVYLNREQVRALSAALRELGSIAWPATSETALRGGALADAAAQALAAEGQPTHYTNLADAVERREGKQINGEDAHATLLAAIGRDARFQSVRPRSGLFTLAEAPDSGAVAHQPKQGPS